MELRVPSHIWINGNKVSQINYYGKLYKVFKVNDEVYIEEDGKEVSIL